MKPFRSVLLCLFTLFGCLHQAMAAKVLNVRSYRAPEYTRLVFDLDAPLQYQLETRAAPDRLVINLKKSMLVGPLDKLSLANTPITKITSAQNKEHDVRVELALDRKVEARGFTLGKNEQYGDRLVIDLYDAVAKTASDGGATADPIGALSASLVTSGKRDIVVAISAGHGGKDTGAIGVKQLEEKQVTLAISREVTEQLGRISGFKAVLIRKGDYYVGLREQINMAHDQHADLFIAIHADAADNKTAKGATVYALSTRGATSELALRQADKENSADLIGGVGTVSLDDKDRKSVV